MSINENVVRQHLHSIFALYHGCALSTNPRSKNRLMPEDIARGLKEGQLCDDCEGQIEAHMHDMKTEQNDLYDLYANDDPW